MHQLTIRFVVLLTIILAFVGCCTNPSDEPNNKVPTERTILVYMLANNNLGEVYRFDERNITDMGEAMSTIEGNGRLLIFYAGYDTIPYLMEVCKERNNSYTTQKLKWYNDAVSTDSATMYQVMMDVRDIAPAKDYGLIMWSHSTNWLPNNRFYGRERKHKPSSFGREGNEELTINLNIMGNVLSQFHHNFILFDACLMGSVEVAYQLRQACDYIIACPTETLGLGFPYREIIPLLLAPEIDYTKVCDKYYDKYIAPNTTYNNRQGTISLIKTDEMESLASCCQKIIENRKIELSKIDLRQIQYYDRTTTHLFYDLYDYMSHLGDSTSMSQLQEIMNNAIPYKAASKTFLGIEILRYSGLSSYIPGCCTDTLTERYYQKLNWYKRVYNENK